MKLICKNLLFVIFVFQGPSLFSAEAIDSNRELSEPVQDRPNILFAFADDWGRHAGAYGMDWLDTPTFDRIADQGILFRQA